MKTVEHMAATSTWYSPEQLAAVTRGAQLDQRTHQLRIALNSLYALLALGTLLTVLGLVPPLTGAMALAVALGACVLTHLALQRTAQRRIQLARALSLAA